MKCPFCGHQQDKVIDSRGSDGGSAVRRRRECLRCRKRFTTYEQVESFMPLVIKRDGRREPYDRTKVLAGLRKACEKRPVSVERIEQVASEIEDVFRRTREREISSRRIGEAVANALRELDDVAYVRFASVYHQFKDVTEFQKEIDRLKRSQRAREIRFRSLENAIPAPKTNPRNFESNTARSDRPAPRPDRRSPATRTPSR